MQTDPLSIGGFVGSLISGAIALFFAIRLELFKHKQSAEMERLRTQLAIESKEHEVRYKSLHERMSVVLDTLFSTLSATHQQLSAVVERAQTMNITKDDGTLETVRRTVRELKERVRRESLFIPDAVEAEVKTYLNRARAILSDISHATEIEKHDGDKYLALVDRLEPQHKQLTEAFSSIRSQLQKLLGFKT